MPHDEVETADHAMPPAQPVAPSAAGPSFVPLAEPMPESAEGLAEFVPSPEDPLGSVPRPPFPAPWPWPGSHPRPCVINLRPGCYRISFKPTPGFVYYVGTMRVDDFGGNTTISGDLYRFFRFPLPLPPRRSRVALDGSPSDGQQAEVSSRIPATLFPQPYDIPIYARNRYHSYLRVTGIQRPPIFTIGHCRLTLTAQQYVYTQPAAGSFNGTFPSPPGTRTVTIVLHPKPAPPGFTSSYFEGTLYESNVARGSFTIGWVSNFFRRATLEIDTLTGSVAPQAVGTEDFRSAFASAGWDLNVIFDQTGVPVPAGVNANACWSNADLHALMTTVRNPATNLDAEWHMHLLVVPATMGCGRGVMYDTIGVPREGVASFSDDGYPSAQSANFGTAANQLQRNVPRAFLRSACHEVGHGFNQIHQEQEGGADNSITHPRSRAVTDRAR